VVEENMDPSLWWNTLLRELIGIKVMMDDT